MLINAVISGVLSLQSMLPQCNDINIYYGPNGWNKSDYLIVGKAEKSAPSISQSINVL